MCLVVGCGSDAVAATFPSRSCRQWRSGACKTTNTSIVSFHRPSLPGKLTSSSIILSSQRTALCLPPPPVLPFCPHPASSRVPFLEPRLVDWIEFHQDQQETAGLGKSLNTAAAMAAAENGGPIESAKDRPNGHANGQAVSAPTRRSATRRRARKSWLSWLVSNIARYSRQSHIVKSH